MGSNAPLFSFHVLMEGRAGPPPPRPSPVGTPSLAVALVGSGFGVHNCLTRSQFSECLVPGQVEHLCRETGA